MKRVIEFGSSGRRIAALATVLVLAGGLAGCADDSNNLTGNTTSGTTGGTTSGTTGGTTSGSTGGTTSGSTGGTTSGNTGGTTSGSTGGTTSGSTGGTTSGTTGGTTSGTTGGTTSGTTGGTTGCTGSCPPPPPNNLTDCSPSSATYRPLVTTSEMSGTNGFCVGCGVSNLHNAFDGDTTTSATATSLLAVGALPGSEATFLSGVGATTFQPFRRAGFFVFDPAGALITAGLAPGITATTTLSTATSMADVESATVASTGLNVDLLGTVVLPSGNEQVAYVNLITTKPFNGLRLNFGSSAGVLTSLNVIEACVSQ